MPLFQWNTNPFANLSLDSNGLIALADLGTIAQRTALTGGASFLDTFLLCPGIHRQQTATELNKGEYPAAAALTTGYAFRIENPATVYFLQRAGLTGHMVTVHVAKKTPKPWYRPQCLHIESTLLMLVLYLCPVGFTLISVLILGLVQDYWGIGILFMLMVARLLNTIVIRRRSYRGSLWKGATEPGVHGDLLVLLSQDRWIRIKGLVDDLKMATSGLWLADTTFVESSAVSFGTLLVYLAAALAANMTQVGSLTLLVLLLMNVGSLALANYWTQALHIHERELKRHGQPCMYQRRRDLADELIESTGRRDWAVALGMVPAIDGEGKVVTM